HGDDVLHLEMIEQEAIDRSIHSLREVVLKPGAVETAHARMTVVFAGKEDDDAVLGEQPHDILRPVEVAVVAVSPVQTADGGDVLELANAIFQSRKPCFEVRHGTPPRVGLRPTLTNAT